MRDGHRNIVRRRTLRSPRADVLLLLLRVQETVRLESGAVLGPVGRALEEWRGMLFMNCIEGCRHEVGVGGAERRNERRSVDEEERG